MSGGTPARLSTWTPEDILKQISDSEEVRGRFSKENLGRISGC